MWGGGGWGARIKPLYANIDLLHDQSGFQWDFRFYERLNPLTPPSPTPLWMFEIGLSLDFRCMLVGCSLDLRWMFDGFSMDFRWIFHGFSMDVRWIFDGFSMDFRRIFEVTQEREQEQAVARLTRT